MRDEVCDESLYDMYAIHFEIEIFGARISRWNFEFENRIFKIFDSFVSVKKQHRASTMANSTRFPFKLTGAKARLFAHTCEQFSVNVEEACNDTPDEHPIFSWLSPQQRLQLVREVMVGLLCPDEPLPPETIQHYATYLALVAMIRVEIQVEIDTVQDDAHLVGDDLLVVFDDPRDNDRMIQTPEERQERIRNRDLISRQAEKNKKKLDRAQVGTDTRPVEDFQAPDVGSEPNRLNIHQKIASTLSSLCVGPPISAEARRLHRPLTDTEERLFCWRRLIDKAFQEHTDGTVFKLCSVDFDWRCPNFKKWECATNLLMIAYNGAEITRSEQVLVEGKIGEVDYADRSQHARIQAIQKIVKDLRDSYDPFWKPDMLAVDQRAIFAVSSSDTSCFAEDQFRWLEDFMASCIEQGFDFYAGGDYQMRLEIYRRMPPLYKEGLSMTFHNGFDEFELARTPTDWEREYVFTLPTCHARGCRSVSEDALKLCSRCKIVSYCSRECQMKDWPDHKKHCKVLAELRKDKAKVSEIVKSRRGQAGD
jgi:hypothetical protein